jgi:MOSC domain-containing protein YiiM
MTLLQMRAGRVRVYPGTSGGTETWTSAIDKQPVSGSVTITPLGIDGDEHGDPVNHGGPDKAILCYAREHYAKWSEELGAVAPPPGTLGENFEIGGRNEEEVCIGDIFQLDGVMLQISQPRQPCWKPGRLHRVAQLAARILKTGRTGWYLRILQGGIVTAPAPLHLLERPHPEWTVARATRVMHFEKDPAVLAELAGVGALSAAWKAALRGEPSAE